MSKPLDLYDLEREYEEALATEESHRRWSGTERHYAATARLWAAERALLQARSGLRMTSVSKLAK